MFEGLVSRLGREGQRVAYQMGDQGKTSRDGSLRWSCEIREKRYERSCLTVSTYKNGSPCVWSKIEVIDRGAV
jgi:hypothetical protein